MTRYVLDTSVVIKWFSQTDEPDIEKALNLGVRRGKYHGESRP